MKTQLTFGSMAVGIPVKLTKMCAEDKPFEFHQACPCGSQIHHENVCSGCGKKVEYADLKKLAEIDGKVVILDKTQLPKLEGGTLNVGGFMTPSELGQIYGTNIASAFKEFYCVGYEKKAKKSTIDTLNQLYTTLRHNKKIGIGKAVWSSKESLIALMAIGNALYVVKMWYPTEIREATGYVETKTSVEFDAFIDRMKPPSADFWTNKTNERIMNLLTGKEALTEVAEAESSFMEAIKTEAKKEEKHIEVS